MYLSQFSSEKLLFAVITVIYNDLQLAKMHAETAECSVLKGTHILHLQGSWMIEEWGGGSKQSKCQRQWVTTRKPSSGHGRAVAH